jgi:1-acyl-sn-glycerol-3-phosphate acyltransferase
MVWRWVLRDRIPADPCHTSRSKAAHRGRLLSFAALQNGACPKRRARPLSPHRVNRFLPPLILPRALAASATATAIRLFARAITAVQATWSGCAPEMVQRVYFANHTSNGDFVLIWTVLPERMRMRTRPVAASDYWLTGKLKAFIGQDVFNAVLIDRRPDVRTEDPVAQMVQALDDGASLILFPEGQRNASDAPLLPLKTGLYHLARQRPNIELVPVWVANLNRVMPKGEVIPIPLVCTVTFGTPMRMTNGEGKDDFLARAAAALLATRAAEGAT